MDVLTALAARWAAEASDLEVRYHDDRGASLFRLCAAELLEAIREAEARVLTLTEASEASGYTSDHLRRLIADGTIPNAGRRGKPLVRRSDLPMKPGATNVGMTEAEEAARSLG